MSTGPHPSVDLYARHVNPAFVKLLGVLGYGRVYARALGTRVWDSEGNEYLDFLAGFGSVNLGHNHPGLLEAVQAGLKEEPLNLVHTGISPRTAELAAALAGLLPDPLQVCTFSSSGAEAVEAGLKIARAATGRKGIVSCQGGFHGMTFGALSVTDDKKARPVLEPLLGHCTAVPFGDLGALEEALAGKKQAAFLVEPVQGEGGVQVPPEGYLKAARDLCRRQGTVIVVDEVQTGLGRTGTTFAFEAEGFTPDVLVLAKALGGSLVPISATIASADVHQKACGSMDRFDINSSTFSGNSLGCIAALATLKILADESLVENSARMGERLLAGLRQGLEGHPFVKDVRGRGLLVGVELGPTAQSLSGRLAPRLVEAASEKIFGQWCALKLLERGMICQPAANHWNVLKLEPPLTVTEQEVDEAVGLVTGVLDEYRSLRRLVFDAGKRMAGQLRKKWDFSDPPAVDREPAE